MEHGFTGMTQQQRNSPLGGTAHQPHAWRNWTVCSSMTSMLIILFDRHETVHHKFISQRHTKNQHYYEDVLFMKICSEILNLVNNGQKH